MEIFSVFNDLTEAISQIKAGNVVGIGILISIIIRGYRMIPKAPWTTDKTAWIVPVVVFVVGLLASLFTGVFAFHMTWGTSIVAAIGVAVNAAGFHSITKTAGQALLAPAEQPTNSLIKKVGSLILPPPKP